MSQFSQQSLDPVRSPQAESALADQLADQVSAVTQAVDGVAGMSAGPIGEIATYLPGRRVPGVRLTENRVEVHIVVTWLADVLATAAEVRRVVAPLVDRPVYVFVDDVAFITSYSPGA